VNGKNPSPFILIKLNGPTGVESEFPYLNQHIAPALNPDKIIPFL